MKKLNITPGKAEVKDHASYVGYANIPLSMGDESSLIAEDDATLYADAHNTYHATGMLPSEMAERIKALEEALRPLSEIPIERFRGGNDPGNNSENPIMSWNYYPDRDPVVLKVGDVLHARALLSPINEPHGHLITNPE